MRDDEARVVEAFAGWLSSQGWTVRTEVDFVDIVAEKDGHHLYVEANAASTAPGLDVDTAIGQLVRRMPSEADQSVSFALVVRDEPSFGGGLRCGHLSGFWICWGWRCMRSMGTVVCGSSSAACDDCPGHERRRSALWSGHRRARGGRVVGWMGR